MEKKDAMQKIAGPLLAWYYQNARELPWRGKTPPNPYHVWVSEIMLQQTRVEAVKPYYERFLKALPTIKDLAEAEEALLMKLWEGLGYYSRVRNMQEAARQVMENYGGNIPSEFTELLKLKGIGPYTAGAIASIAFLKPCAAVDGNVLRVMARVMAHEGNIAEIRVRKYWEKEIAAVMPPDMPGDFNQALMELGATICLPNGAPKCSLCPLRMICRAYQDGQIAMFPVKGEKAPRKQERLAVFFLVSGNKIALRRRPAKGLLSNLWELPNCPRDGLLLDFLQEIGIYGVELNPLPQQKHIFTHIEWHMECYFGNVYEKRNAGLLWATKEEAEEMYALPSAFKKIWKEGLKRMGDL